MVLSATVWSVFRSRWRFIGIVLVLIAGAFVVWRSAQIGSGVRVFSDGEPWDCVDSEVTLWPYDLGMSDYQVPVVPASADLDCELRFFVANDSGARVVLEQVRFAVLGPNAGAAAVATRLDSVTGTVLDGPVPGEIDAVWNVDEVLEPGVAYPHRAKLAFRPDGCLSQGGAMWAPWPVIEVRWFGFSRTIEPDTTQVGLLGTPDSSCDE